MYDIALLERGILWYLADQRQYLVETLESISLRFLNVSQRELPYEKTLI